ncbi:MAG: M15 family metallopeptidase [Brevundimonas sp.]|jgi:peptidoglycan LD-endopeptidase CwlK
MPYVLGAKSRAELKGVHPDLVRVVERAIQITTQDFSVHDGLRTAEEQKALVAAGASQTMNSMHRTQADGFGHAVDLVPFVNGKMRWEWPAIYPIAVAVWQASRELGVSIRWGGAWINMAEIKTGTPGAMKAAVDAYGAARRKLGKAAFTDGPHFELAR